MLLGGMDLQRSHVCYCFIHAYVISPRFSTASWPPDVHAEEPVGLINGPGAR